MNNHLQKASIVFLPQMSVILKALLDYNTFLSLEEIVFIIFCLKRDVCCLTGGMPIISLLSIEIIETTVGMSTVDSCTQKSLICVYLKIFF